MTKLTRKQLIEEYVTKLQEIRKKSEQLLHQVVREGREEFRKIDQDVKFSPQGRAMEKKAAQAHYKEQFLKYSAELKAEHARYLSMAKRLSLEVTSAPPANNMSDTQNAAFEAQLADLKTRILLHPNPANAVDLVEKFVKENKDEYKAYTIAKQFNQIIAPIAPTLQQAEKYKLMQAYDLANHYTINEEKGYAQQVLDLPDDVRFFLTQHDAPSFVALRSIIGRRGAEAANDPERELAAMESGASVEDELFGREPEQTETSEQAE